MRKNEKEDMSRLKLIEEIVDHLYENYSVGIKELFKKYSTNNNNYNSNYEEVMYDYEESIDHNMKRNNESMENCRITLNSWLRMHQDCELMPLFITRLHLTEIYFKIHEIYKMPVFYDIFLVLLGNVAEKCFNEAFWNIQYPKASQKADLLIFELNKNTQLFHVC